jgi:hypothetical protein
MSRPNCPGKRGNMTNVLPATFATRFDYTCCNPLRQTGACSLRLQSLAITAEANSDVLTSWAPSICRAKS